ncbi:odorant receptor 98a-like [Drosophila miranda]|uniref:odorant receptor 98a-like n=1 Tax=Drosophila miranda TaxID=7229 RepID=UPI00143F8665|nr:odorant receptor 98a-like [Drosophila miranda]
MWRYHKIKELLGRMDKRCINITERLEVHRWVARCNIAYLIYQFMYTAYTLSTFFTAIFSGVVPFHLYNPFIDWRESTLNLWIASVMELIPMNGITFPFYFTCDLLKDDCESLALAIFHSHWRSSSRRYKSSLIYFLHNAQMPISFTAGSIFSISLNTNITVAKLAFSVVTFV